MELLSHVCSTGDTAGQVVDELGLGCVQYRHCQGSEGSERGWWRYVGSPEYVGVVCWLRRQFCPCLLRRDIGAFAATAVTDVAAVTAHGLGPCGQLFSGAIVGRFRLMVARACVVRHGDCLCAIRSSSVTHWQSWTSSEEPHEGRGALLRAIDSSLHYAHVP